MKSQGIYPPPLINVEHLSKSFPINNGFFKKTILFNAVDNVSFHIKQGETLALLGKTGSGKSTIGLTILRLIEPDAGDVFYNDICITKLKLKNLQKIRKDLQIIFQDPDTSLNPIYNVGTIISEMLLYHKTAGKNLVEDRIDTLLQQVGLSPKAKIKFPSEFSLGQKQRICIARVLAAEPRFIVLDEVTSSLDYINQHKIINLLQKLQDELGLSYLFITHNIELLKTISNRVAFLQSGKIIECGDYNDVIGDLRKYYINH